MSAIVNSQAITDCSAILRIPLIQGGMGVGVSGWKLARASALAGAIGTVSGTAVSNLVAYSLQKGDPGGHFRRSFARFPYPEIADSVIKAYFVEGGIPEGAEQKSVPMFSFDPPKLLIALTVCANFAFIDLAKEGHSNPIFVNLMCEVPMPNLYSVLGVMLARVDGIVMGAGIPKDTPKLIDDVIDGEDILFPVHVTGASNGGRVTNSVNLEFSCVKFFGKKLQIDYRPLFLPIVASNTLAERLLKSYSGKINGFIVEGSTAGGHNAPPRGRELIRNERGEPVYGVRDIVDMNGLRSLGVPFWLAGSYASPLRLKEAQETGAVGVQVGSAFAFCDESGIRENLKFLMRKEGFNGRVDVYTDPDASPTGFPFKVARLDGTLSDPELYNARKRNCSIGFLREAFMSEDGKIRFRCSAEPIEDYKSKGGCVDCTVKTVCLCNTLLSTVVIRNGELPLVTSGDCLDIFKVLMEDENSSYKARDVVDYMMGA